MKLFPAIDPQHELTESYPYHLAQLLVNRSINTKEEAHVFTNPSWDNIHDPFLLHNAQEVVERIKKAIEDDEHITIYADYDADGIPGSIVLSSLLDKIGYQNYEVYLPHRHSEGYGLHLDALQSIKDSGSTLVITIDVGITAHEEALWCKEHNIDLIITDHHEPKINEDGNENLPQALYVVNPKQESCTYPDDMLCGAGVIYKCVQAFVKTYGEEYNIAPEWEKWLLDMVGLATISDMVPLQKENRLFAYFGMKVIQKTKRPGLKKLIWDAGLSINHLTEEDLAFSVTPKLNAASRMSHPEDARQALTLAQESKAYAAVKNLDELNKERKKLVAQNMKDINAKLKGRPETKVIVIGGRDWNHGILGILASKITEKYNKCAFVWSEENDTIKGSIRSSGGVDILELMNLCENNTFIQYGGHKQAGGFSCEKQNIHHLQERLDQAFDLYCEHNQEPQTEEIEVDMKLDINDININFYNETRTLAPFGQANPKPRYLIEQVLPDSMENFGKQKNHLKLSFHRKDGSQIQGIQFFKTIESYPKLQNGEVIDLIAEVSYSVFRGKHELRLSIVDII